MRLEITLVIFAIVTILLLGAISLIASVRYNSSILAFIGLGLIFWGAILLYVRPEEYTKRVLMEAVSAPPLTALYQIIREFGYKGDTTYLPPKCFTNPDTTKVYISKSKRGTLPTPEQTQTYENQPVARTTLGLMITPPGIELSKLLEKSLGKCFTKTDLKNLQQNLPKLFIEDLEIAEGLELEVENDMTQRKEDQSAPTNIIENAPSDRPRSTIVHVKMIKPVYKVTFKEDENSSQSTGLIGCPICSAIAIALTRATGKLVRITDIKSSEDRNILVANYEILEG
jgi:hypothetical protein